MRNFLSILTTPLQTSLVGKELSKLTSVLIFRENYQLLNQNALTIAAANALTIAAALTAQFLISVQIVTSVHIGLNTSL